MTLEITLRESCSGLASERATERKRGAESLKTFLSGTAAPALLSTNTCKRTGINWSNVFDDVHDFVLKETEKYETSKTFHNAVKPLASSLLHMVVAGSNKGKAFIKCDKITGACLCILTNKRLTKAVGDIYISLLYKYVLPCSHYKQYFTPQTWEELLDVCITASTSKNCNVDNYTKLKLVWLVMDNGRKYCQFSNPLRDAVHRIQKDFVVPVVDKKLQEVVIDISLVLLETLATEYRRTMCSFSEKIATSLVKYYDQNGESKKKASLFKVLNLVFNLHHPKGTLQGETLRISQKTFLNILEVVYVEVAHLQKSTDGRFRLKNDIKDCTELYHLAASVHQLMFNMPDIVLLDDNESTESASKRRKLSINKNKSFSDLIDQFRQHSVPWLGILNVYVKSNVSTLTALENMLLLSALENYVCNNKTGLNWELFEQLTCVVLKNLSFYQKTQEIENILLQLWNSCVRHCTVVNTAHKALHRIIQSLLQFESINLQLIPSLSKLYMEKAMPVSDSSVATLSEVLRVHFSRYNNPEDRLQCIAWLTEHDNIVSDALMLQNLLIRLIATENEEISVNNKAEIENERVYNVLFHTVEECVMYSEFELQLPAISLCASTNKRVEINNQIELEVAAQLEYKLTEQTNKLKNKEIKLIEFVKLVQIVLCYYDGLLSFTNVDATLFTERKSFKALMIATKFMFSEVTGRLCNIEDNNVLEVEILKAVQELFLHKFNESLGIKIAECIQENFFHSVHKGININIDDENDVMAIDEIDEDFVDVKRACIHLLASYCVHNKLFKQDILAMILDAKLYNFHRSTEAKCAFKCLNILIENNAAYDSLEKIFNFLKSICSSQFRCPEVVYGIVKALMPILEEIWSNPERAIIKKNCLIMIDSFLQRSETRNYPPHVAALIFECIARIEALNRKLNGHCTDKFMDKLVAGSRGGMHTLRLYCAHLLKYVAIDFDANRVDAFIDGSAELFQIIITDSSETILNDEKANRALTILHSFMVLAQTQPALLGKIVTAVLKLQINEKIDKILAKQVLDKMTKSVTSKGIHEYLNQNSIEFFHFWFKSKYDHVHFPLSWFGFDNMDKFLEKYYTWLIPAETIWCREGNIKDSKILQEVKIKSDESEENIVEVCFCNIIVLCLPFVVGQKCGLEVEHGLASAKKLFQVPREILGDQKFSDLFVENMGELVLLSMTTYDDIKRICGLNVPVSAILNYFGELIGGNILTNLCENQPYSVAKLIVKKWECVLQQSILELKVKSLQSYQELVENIPLGHFTDAFVCNFACSSILCAAENAKTEEELKLLLRVLNSFVHKFTPANLLPETLRRTEVLLSSKSVAVCQSGSSQLLKYLEVNAKDQLKRDLDQSRCASLNQFTETLKLFVPSLHYPSFEHVNMLRRFLKINTDHIVNLRNTLKVKGFSEECENSVLHGIINSLNKILTTATDDKTVIEACNCVAEIGTYDLKTLVAHTPPDSKRIVDVKPAQYLAISALNCLSEILFHDDPAIVGQVMISLASLLKYREGQIALDSRFVDLQTLKPFVPTEFNNDEINTSNFTINEEKFDSFREADFWIPKEGEDHREWVKRLTISLLDIIAKGAKYVSSLRDVCKSQPNLCRQILPSTVGAVLGIANEQAIQVFASQMDNFFEYIVTKFYTDSVSEASDNDVTISTTVRDIDHDLKIIVQDVLNVVDFIRLQRNHYPKRPDSIIETHNYLKLRYENVSAAAAATDDCLTGIFYGELWAVAGNSGVPPASPAAVACLPAGERVQGMLRKCFTAIGEMDAIQGCGSGHLTIEDERRRHLARSGQHAASLLAHDIALSHAPPTPSSDAELRYGVVSSLHRAGLHHLALQYMKSLPETDKLNDIKYECLSYLGDWSVFVDQNELEAKTKSTGSLLKGMQYLSLKHCINVQEDSFEFEKKLDIPLSKAKLAVSKLSRILNMDNCQSVYKVVSKLQLFHDIEDYFAVRCAKLSMPALLKSWELKSLPPFHSFMYIEPLITQRSLILEDAAKRYRGLQKDIVGLQLQYAVLGLSNQRIQLSQRLLAIAKKTRSSAEVALVEGQVSWATGHQEIALSLVRSVIAEEADVKLTASAYRQYGSWMAEGRSENARDIIDKYLQPNLDVLARSGHADVRLRVYHDIAKFADDEYRQVVDYMKSTIFENKVKCIENMKGAASSVKRSSQQNLTRDERKALLTNEKLSNLDQAEIENTKKEKQKFLELAMRYYLLSLQQGDDNNLSVFRVISLWLDNPSLSLSGGGGGGGEAGGGTSFEGLLRAVPSHKYVPVLPQLAPRLSDGADAFNTNLLDILRRCSTEHPHHTLPILFALKNSDKDRCILNASAAVGGARGGGRGAHEEPRVVAAGNLLDQLACDDRLTTIIEQMDRMCNAIISIANYEIVTKEVRQSVPRSEPIRKLVRLEHVPIPTITIPVRSNGDYSDLPGILSFADSFELVGGINCPKKMTCRGTDGKDRILLIKGKDDLRQDAVMQQVFSILNTLLAIDPVTSRDRLLIRTYKVVALSRQSGVLQWCAGTVPLGVYLVGTGNAAGAHRRYRPMDISCSLARETLTRCHKEGRSNIKKLEVFNDVLKGLKPVFHYFFTEHYLEPPTWYERRLAYTKSVATSSMVGYIMGLGDRHVQNILIDKRTAEVIHIDFGIAFDQGKALPTPETVPFRLTQDMVAGFGSSGVEGIFRRCCEKTMQVLRDNHSALLTILEVLLCDPLYTWCVTPAEAKRKQNILPATPRDTSTLALGQTPSVGSGLAERALLAVSCKLSGTEGGAAGGVAVPGQVARLLHAATDRASLSRLFPGWQPYL